MSDEEKIEILTNALTGIYWVVSEYEMVFKDRRFKEVYREIHDALEATGQRPEWLK